MRRRAEPDYSTQPRERTGSDTEICAVLRGFCEPWLFQDAVAAAESLRRTGFVELETSIESAPTVLDSAEQYQEFVRNIIFRRHLENIPSEELRSEFMAELTTQAAGDDPAFSLDYWRMNLRGAQRQGPRVRGDSSLKYDHRRTAQGGEVDV